jgi:hypothetical protein
MTAYGRRRPGATKASVRFYCLRSIMSINKGIQGWATLPAVRPQVSMATAIADSEAKWER